METKCKIGDVFAIPVGDHKLCYGQIVAKSDPIYYMIAFDVLCPDTMPLNIQAIVGSPILFLGNFFDSLIKNKDWKIVGNIQPRLGEIPFPAYRVQIQGKTYAESWDGEYRRLATDEEARLLDNPANFGPVWLEDALKAHFGFGPDDPKFGKFRLDYVAARAIPGMAISEGRS